jgi:hypothetical protein
LFPRATRCGRGLPERAPLEKIVDKGANKVAKEDKVKKEFEIAEINYLRDRGWDTDEYGFWQHPAFLGSHIVRVASNLQRKKEAMELNKKGPS